MFQFITKRPLWANILFAIVLLFLLLFLFLTSLDWLTHHGKILRIPQVTGKTLAEATKELDKQGFDIVIQDSVYVDTLPPLAVTKQFPEADAVVKENRKVYLTVNRAEAPMINMPQLVGQSFRSAAIVLKQFGLKLGDTSYVPDFAKNSVKNQLYKDQEIPFGTKVPMGATIDLVLSSGISDADMPVPDLFGMTLGDAKVLLEGNGLSFGAINPPNVKDSLSAYIYKQIPARMGYDNKLNRIHQGQLMDIWIQTEKPLRSDTTNKSPDSAPNNY